MKKANFEYFDFGLESTKKSNAGFAHGQLNLVVIVKKYVDPTPQRAESFHCCHLKV